MNALPTASRPFVEFPAVLRMNGFAVAPDQTIGFIEAVGLLGPRGIGDVRRAAIAMLSIPREREEEFDTIFRAFFYGETAAGVFADEEEEDVEAREPTGDESEETVLPDEDAAGESASREERLARREFIPRDIDAALARFSRLAPARLPRRLSYRHAPDRRGRLLDMRRTLREATRRGGEVFELAKRKRKSRQRRVVLLIDISGSMSERTDDAMRFAYVLARSTERLEVFTLGTRLTRVTQALQQRNERRALERVTAMVADVDGGTRIGEALQTFLAIPRYSGFARGALVIVLSDGLERGSPEAMTDAMRRLARIAWRIEWLSPLATEGYVPETAGLTAVLPYLSSLGDGSDIATVADHVLGLERMA